MLVMTYTANVQQCQECQWQCLGCKYDKSQRQGVKSSRVSMPGVFKPDDVSAMDVNTSERQYPMSINSGGYLGQGCHVVHGQFDASVRSLSVRHADRRRRKQEYILDSLSTGVCSCFIGLSRVQTAQTDINNELWRAGERRP